MEMTQALLVAEVGPEGDRHALRQAYVAVAVRKWRDGEHDRHREPGQAPERAPIAGQELPEEFGPAIGLEHRKNGIPGVANRQVNSSGQTPSLFTTVFRLMYPQ
jgi:hypothetical protein